MTEFQADPKTLVKRLLIGSEILARHPSEWYGGQQETKEAAERIEDLEAEARKSAMTYLQNNGQLQDRVYFAERVVEAMKGQRKTGDAWRKIWSALDDHDDFISQLRPTPSPEFEQNIGQLTDRLQSAERVAEAARKLVYEIDQTYDVDNGSPNYPFISEWQDLRDALDPRDEAKP